MAIEIEKRRSAAIVWMDNPPVNAIGHALRRELMDAVSALDGDDGIERVILTGRNAIFAAGADAREFDLPPAEPHLPDVINAMERAEKPWIAAIDGAALGGGAELALGCRYRIASPRASIGFPEVNLGLVPGAGGTQRLPRLIGLAEAAAMAAQGAPVKASEALASGLVDEIADDPVAAAMTVAADALAAIVPVSRRAVPAIDDGALDGVARDAARKLRGQLAPGEAMALIRASATLPFAQGMQKERETFMRLRGSPQARALRHVFFAERGARAPDRLKDVAPADFSSAVVVGGGTMGSGIAYALAIRGTSVTVIETAAEAAGRARDRLEGLVAEGEKRGALDARAAAAIRARLQVRDGYGDLPPAGLAIEAAFEDMAVKKQVFGELQAALPADAILATNTSYLDVDQIADTIADPERVIGLHFFSPAHVMKLLEIVKGARTGDRALATGFALAKKLGKIPVVSGVCDGFIGNRILARYREVADQMVIDGAMPWEVDAAMREFGYAMGPYEVQDLAGLDIGYATRKRQAPNRDPHRRYVAIADRLVEMGRLGRKTGTGWYRHEDGKALPDPATEAIVLEESGKAGITRRSFAPDEIRDRLIAALVNEACNILEEGIAERASDIDLVQIHGYGFPRWRGGPMHHAQAVGLETILSSILRYAAEDPVVWRCSPLLERLVAEGSGF